MRPQNPITPDEVYDALLTKYGAELHALMGAFNEAAVKGYMKDMYSNSRVSFVLPNGITKEDKQLLHMFLSEVKKEWPTAGYFAFFSDSDGTNHITFLIE